MLFLSVPDFYAMLLSSLFFTYWNESRLLHCIMVSGDTDLDPLDYARGRPPTGHGIATRISKGGGPSLVVDTICHDAHDHLTSVTDTLVVFVSIR